MKISIWHNILWSRYKAVVFSSIHRKAKSANIDVNFYQIAETDANRAGLSPIDKRWHQYPYMLLFPGATSDIPRFKLFSKISWLTLKDGADVTILSGYEQPVVWLQALILTLKRRRFAVFCDSTIFDNRQTFIKSIAKRFFFNWADGIFCYGLRAMEYVTFYGVPKNKIFGRCQAAALVENYSATAALQQRLSLAPESGRPRYLYVGRLSPEKSLDHLLEAFRQTLNTLPEAELVLVGKGPLVEDLRALAAHLGIKKRVIFTGSKFDHELFEEYSKATCLMLPSESEPWGLVVNEALSYGCPVIVSYRCGCVPELVCEGKTGFVFEWGDVKDLADKMAAAPRVFSNIAVTAAACLEQIAPFTPEAAAQSIINGCFRLVGEEARDVEHGEVLSAHKPNDELRLRRDV